MKCMNDHKMPPGDKFCHICGTMWVRIYAYEFNNGSHWGYTEPRSRVFRTQFEEAEEEGGKWYGIMKQGA